MLKAVSTANGLISPTFSGDVTLSTGNLVIGTAGKGIDFSADASAAGMTSELLDDYEEGTWTPTIEPATNSFTSVTYSSVRGGRYTKVGNKVFFQCTVRTESITVGTASGAIRIGGLPFTSATNSLGDNAVSPISVGFTSNWAVNFPSQGWVRQASTLVSLSAKGAINAAPTVSNVTDLGTGAAANEIMIAGCYITA